MARADLTAEAVRALLRYDPATGEFTWLVRRRGVPTRRPAARPDNHGYLNLTIAGTTYKAHRIAWLMVHGVWPEGELDHVDGGRSHNALANLRPATHAENGQNRATQRNSRSGLPGASWNEARQCWRAQIAVDGKRKFLGSFATAQLAHEAYLAAKAALHPFQPAPRGGAKYGAKLKTRPTS